MNQHLAQGIVIFTVDRDRDMDIDMINHYKQLVQVVVNYSYHNQTLINMFQMNIL